MVVRIKTGKRIQGALTYNEQKVRQGKAELILASRFGAELQNMGFSQKLERFQLLTRRNQYVKRNTLHLSINFSPNDRVDQTKMQAIAHDYMKRIGFGEQPYLVYYHKDTAHPHLHIVTTNIRPNARPINMHNLAILKSEPARKAMEIEYSLIPAESVKREVLPVLRPVNLVGVLSGKQEEKRQLSNVVKNVVASYQFRNLDEYNAILRFFNVQADPGAEGSRLHNYKGLIYTTIDQHGERIGVGVKASDIDGQPTLKNLTWKFALAEKLRESRLEKSKAKLEKVMALPYSLAHHLLTSPDSKVKIDVRPQFNETGEIDSFMVLDHQTKIITSTRELGLSVGQMVKTLQPAPEKKLTETTELEENDFMMPEGHFSGRNPTTDILKELLFSQDTTGGGGSIKPKRKKKKKP